MEIPSDDSSHSGAKEPLAELQQKIDAAIGQVNALRETSEQIRQSLGDVQPIAQVCAGRFHWKGEFLYKIISDVQIELTLGGEKRQLPLDQLVFRFWYSLEFACIEGRIQVLDWEYDVDHVDTETGVKIPEVLKQFAKDIFSVPFFEVGQEFEGDQNGTDKTVGETCIELLLKARVKAKGKFAATISVKGGGTIGFEIKAGATFRARANFRICCCAAKGESPGQSKCSWSAELIEYKRENFDQGRAHMVWELNANLGACGDAEWRTNIAPLRREF